MPLCSFPCVRVCVVVRVCLCARFATTVSPNSFSACLCTHVPFCYTASMCLCFCACSIVRVHLCLCAYVPVCLCFCACMRACMSVKQDYLMIEDCFVNCNLRFNMPGFHEIFTGIGSPLQMFPNVSFGPLFPCTPGAKRGNHLPNLPVCQCLSLLQNISNTSIVFGLKHVMSV